MSKRKIKPRVAIFCEAAGQHPYGGPVIRIHNIGEMLQANGVAFRIFHVRNAHPDYDLPGRMIKIDMPYTDKIPEFCQEDFNVFWVEQGANSGMSLNKMGIVPIMGTNLVPNSAAQHCYPFADETYKSHHKFYRKMEKQWVKKLKGKFWLSQSDFQEKEYRKLGLDWDIPVCRAPNPVDIHKFYPIDKKPKELIIGFSGKDNWAKHVVFLKEIASHFPNITFHYFSDEKSKVDLGPNVKQILGNTNKEMPKLLQECSMFISTSVTENQPLGVLEAMATGLPVVAFRTSGIPEVVKEGYNGRLADLGNLEHFIIELKRLLRNPGEQERLGRNGRKYMEENFSYDACYKIYQDIFQKYLESE